LDYWFKIGYLVGDVYVEDEVSEKSNRHLIP
jgi:hypothetical protein